MAKFRVVVPYVDDMGSIQPFQVRETELETRAQSALWQINSMRARDGLPALSRMPNGTKYERVK